MSPSALLESLRLNTIDDDIKKNGALGACMFVSL